MPSLSRAEAADRAALVRVHGYDIDLDLTGSDAFTSATTVRFGCARPGAATFVELRPIELVRATLNGKPLDPASLVDNRLPLPDLQTDNTLVVLSTNAYSRTSEGLHRFVDPVDGETYLYGQSPLDEAQRVFACFDQPDLKAAVRLRVTVPPQWTVRANAPGRSTAPGRWEFDQSRPIATYHWTLVAGPYHVIESAHDGIPLGLLCRRSMADRLDPDAEDLFGATRAAFDRLHELFGVRYPFGKYDQAFVPDFTWSAVENPGCVNFKEEFLIRSADTGADDEMRTVVVAHELAHMWFGNLVTLRWWDDIWLNEAFAELLGWRVAAEATRYRDAWSTFALRRKAWGYAADQRPSTHPVVAAEVTDTAHALANFDGISYAKGASALRQLVALIGDEAFLAGVRAYFAAHAFGNATFADFLAAISTAANRNLTDWARVWLRESGVNTLRPVAATGPDGRYTEVSVVQSGLPIRPHRIGVGVYTATGRTRTMTVTVASEHTTVDGLVGAEPGLLLVNDDDLTYAKVRLDEVGRAALPDVLAGTPDPLARAVLWGAAGDAARDAELPPEEFLALVAAALPHETRPATLEDVLLFARTWVVDRFLPPSDHARGRALLAGVCASIIAGAGAAAEAGTVAGTGRVAGAGDGRRLIAARELLEAAGPDRVGLLAGWLAGRDVPAGLTVDEDLRWALTRRLASLGALDADAITAEQLRDPSAYGAEQSARCRAALPDPAAKDQAWEYAMAGGDTPIRLASATAEGFWQPEFADRPEPAQSYVERYFAEVPAMAARSGPALARLVGGHLFPRYAVAADTVARAETLLARPDLDPILRRVIIDRTDDLRRAVTARLLPIRSTDPARPS